MIEYFHYFPTWLFYFIISTVCYMTVLSIVYFMFYMIEDKYNFKKFIGEDTAFAVTSFYILVFLLNTTFFTIETVEYISKITNYGY